MLVVPVDMKDRMAPKRRDALVIAAFGNSEHVAIDDPGELIGNFLALCEGHRHLDRETALRVPDDLAFDTADLIEIDDDTFADCAAHGRVDRESAGRHIHGLTRKFAPILQHIAAKQSRLRRADGAAAR